MGDPLRPEDFGESGKLVLNQARRVAADLESLTIGTPHLFLGVVALEDLFINRRFAAAGVDLEAIARRVRRRLAAEGGDAGLPFDATVAALEEARRAASAQTNSLIEAPHILIGVLRDLDGLVVRALREASADVDELDTEL